MSKIHPDAENKKQYDHVRLVSKECISDDDGRCPCALTVWKRSSMSFQGTDGFTVFDQHGRLVFRVDNYSRKNGSVAGGGGLVLMDGAGNALLTLKPQMLRLQTQWNAYSGDQSERRRSSNQSVVFSMRSCSSGLFRNRKGMIAEVFMVGKQNQTPEYRIEGSFRARDCRIRKASGQVVAKMARKRANTSVLLNSDVFSLFVQPGFDAELVMAFVIILDRMSSKPFTPLLCS
ncbi:protein LURP-one-related 5-like [Tripterygium wilfordii]|uniref:Protein LURP-one-related 5-like n=1 Tax=Tripterygium wilfordii TaxID=458696 RepID=A0A7J7DMV7_TRIWF|nr:protein LURP-one-related 5-like [Tripterygium wilfordii]KAF5747700.1 protein LURP-one-related 5-like [Tripterygium wilfordii]